MYDDDLSDLVRSPRRSNEAARRRLVNSPLTRAYLEAGVRLMRREFTEAAVDAAVLRPLDSLTRQAVIHEVSNGPPELPQRGTIGSFRDRWAYFPDYRCDLARYVLRVQRWSPYSALADEAARTLSRDVYSAAAHEIGFRVMQMVTKSTAQRFRFLATALALRDENLRQALASVYQSITSNWTSALVAVTNRRGLVPRSGITLEEIATIQCALAEGLAMRMFGDPDAQVMDVKSRQNLFSKMMLVLLIGCTDTGDGASLEEAADRIASSNATE